MALTIAGRHTARATLATLGLAAIVVTGCAAPGAVATPTPTAPPASATPGDSSAPSASAVATVPDCGTEPVTLNIYHETISELMPQLSAEFTKQFPNVTFELKSDAFANATANLPRLLASDNPPDISRAAQLIDLVKDGLLLNFDPYATAYGWDAWPQGQFEAVRVNSDFKRGTGPIIAWPVLPSTVGVFYNKDQAAQIGMTAPPKTVEEFDALLAKAKAAGLQPIMEWNASTSGGGLAFPLQNLMAAYGDHSTINDWVFLKEGATIETPEFLQATQKLDEWIKNGYFPSDVNAIEYSDAAGRFGKGEGVFTFNGDWQNAGYDTDQPGKVGFFTFPGERQPVRRRDLRHRREVQAPGLRRVLPELGVDQRQGARDRRQGRRREPGRPARWLDAVGSRRLGHVRDPECRRRRRRRTAVRWTSSPTRRAPSSSRAGPRTSRSSSAGKITPEELLKDVQEHWTTSQ